MISGVALHSVRSVLFCLMISWPAANGIMCVNPARYTVSPSLTYLDTASFIDIILFESILSLPICIGDELEPVSDDTLLGVYLPELRPDRHPHLDLLGWDVRHLPYDLGALGELADRDRVRPSGLLLIRELRGRASSAYEHECVDRALPAQLQLLELRGGVAVLAYALRREVHRSALLALLPHPLVSLRYRAPVPR